MTFQQVADEFNLPSVRTLRTLRSQGLPTIKLGAARLVDYDDMAAFIERKKEVTAAPVQFRTRFHARIPIRNETSTQAAYDRLFAPKPKGPKKK